MPGPLKVLAAAALLLSLACEPRAAAPVYGPWEEGLTLAFEDPSQPQPQRMSDRLQLRVAHSNQGPDKTLLVQLDLTSIRGGLSMLARFQGGGVALVDPEGRVLSQSLPAGFPSTATWTDRGTEFRVLGRAGWTGAALLPATADPVGVWVEARTPQRARRRSLYLPNLGEVESQEERDGAWVTVNRLVARGFTDLPAMKRP